MLSQFINYLLSKAEYLKDENNIIIAKVPNFQGFYSQGENREEARLNLQDAIEGVIFLKLQAGNKELLNQINIFTSSQLVHA